MSGASLLIITCFFLLAAIGSWFGFERKRGMMSLGRLGWVISCFAMAFLLLALWWRVPVSVQAQVDQASRRWSGGTIQASSCQELRQVLPSLERVSRGTILITSAGQVRIPALLWPQLQEQQREALRGLAFQAYSCANAGKARGDIEVIDSESGRLIARLGPGPR